jgi:hypothetical protein
MRSWDQGFKTYYNANAGDGSAITSIVSVCKRYSQTVFACGNSAALVTADGTAMLCGGGFIVQLRGGVPTVTQNVKTRCKNARHAGTPPSPSQAPSSSAR